MIWQFVHIPKCGGMSFRLAYQDYEQELSPTHDPAYMLPDDVRTVAVMRHPLDRFVSIYAHRYGKTEGIREWIDSGEWQSQPTLIVDKRGSKLSLPLSLPQVEWVREDTHIILFEEYQSGLDAWADVAGYPRRELQQRNKSQRDPGWAKYLREDQAAMLWRHYAADVERRRGAREVARG